MSVQIVIDSACDLPKRTADSLGLHFVSMRTIFDGVEYLDGVTLTGPEFYQKLIESDALPTTSQVPPAEFEDAFERIVSQGDTALCITVSSKLSGTYQSACIAAEEFPGRVHVVDSMNVALGSAILAEMALQLADSGMEAREIAERITAERENVHLIAMVNTLEYLRRGGRVSKTAAFAGELLSIKPVIAVRGEKGEVEILGKARGSRQANNLLVKEIEAAGGVDFEKPVMMGYTGLSDQILQKYIRDSAALWQDHADALRSTIIGSVIGTHAGPGAIAVAFFKKN